MRSAWRGEAGNGITPSRMMSCLGIAEAMNSMEQQASPNWNIHREYFRLQLRRNDTGLGSRTRWTRCRPSPSTVTTPTPASLEPLQDLLAPGVGQAQGEDPDEDDHLDERGGADLEEDHGPGEEEDRLDVEDHEQEAEEVVTDLGLRPASADGVDAALVGKVLLRAGYLRTDQLVEAERAGDEQQESACEEGQGQVLAVIAGGHFGLLLLVVPVFARYHRGDGSPGCRDVP